jgi:hypothetical protein
MLRHRAKKINAKPVLSCNLKPTALSSDSQLIKPLPAFIPIAPNNKGRRQAEIAAMQRKR